MTGYSEHILKGGKLVAWQRFARFRLAADEIRKYKNGQKVEELLDIGAADGIGLPYLTPLAKHVTSLNYYSKHTKEFKQIHPDETVITADVRTLTMPEDSFDIVVSFETLHCLPNPLERKKALSQIARVLKPGGLFVCTVPIEVGYSAFMKLVARSLTDHKLKGMDFRMACRHCFYPFFNLEKFDYGSQVGFNAYQFKSDIAQTFKVLNTKTIPIPILLPMNYMIVSQNIT